MPPRVQWVPCTYKNEIRKGHNGKAARHKVGTGAYYACMEIRREVTAANQAAREQERAEVLRLAQERAAAREQERAEARRIADERAAARKQERAEARRVAQERAAARKAQRAGKRARRRSHREIKRANKYCNKVLTWNERYQGNANTELIKAIAVFATDRSSGFADLLAEEGNETGKTAAQDWASSKGLESHTLCALLRDGATAIRSGVCGRSVELAIGDQQNSR
jgi:hypothetical protein